MKQLNNYIKSIGLFIHINPSIDRFLYPSWWCQAFSPHCCCNPPCLWASTLNSILIAVEKGLREMKCNTLMKNCVSISKMDPVVLCGSVWYLISISADWLFWQAHGEFYLNKEVTAALYAFSFCRSLSVVSPFSLLLMLYPFYLFLVSLSLHDLHIAVVTVGHFHLYLSSSVCV